MICNMKLGFVAPPQKSQLMTDLIQNAEMIPSNAFPLHFSPQMAAAA